MDHDWFSRIFDFEGRVRGSYPARSHGSVRGMDSIILVTSAIGHVSSGICDPTAFLKAVQRSRFKRVMRVLVYQVSQSLDCPVWCVFMVTQKVMPEEWKIFDRAGQAGRKAWVKKVLNSLIVQNEI